VAGGVVLVGRVAVAAGSRGRGVLGRGCGGAPLSAAAVLPAGLVVLRWGLRVGAAVATGLRRRLALGLRAGAATSANDR